MDGSQGMKEMKWTDSIEKMALKVLTRTVGKKCCVYK